MLRLGRSYCGNELMNNAAGKIIGTVKVELEYSHLRGEKPNIAFLDDRVSK